MMLERSGESPWLVSFNKLQTFELMTWNYSNEALSGQWMYANGGGSFDVQHELDAA